MNEIRNNLQRIMHEKSWNAYDLSTASGVPQPTIQRFLSGKHGDPRSSTIKKLAIGLGITESELRNLVQQNAVKDMASNAYETRSLGEFSKIPVVGIAQLGDNGHWTELEYPIGHGDGFIPLPTRNKNAYALKCRGDSMLPRIKNGEFVVIEPNTEVMPGDEVLVKATDGRVMIKTYLYTRDEKVHLISINEAHPPQSIPLESIEKMHAVTAIVKKTLWQEN